MKIPSKLLYVIIILGFFNANAQYAKILDFDGSNGSQPYGTPVISENVLYGITNKGGIPGNGIIFSINIDGSNYKKLFEFNDTIGKNPFGSLIISNNVLYGMTSSGGEKSGQGTIFSIKSDGTEFKTLKIFNPSDSLHDGINPHGSLLLTENVLYGLTVEGGLYQKGTIFSIKIDGSDYKKIYDFNGIDGEAPYADLVISANTLYGTTYFGGNNNSGVVFSIGNDGKGYKKLCDFPLGTSCISAPILFENKLFGVSPNGGENFQGFIFSVNTDGSDFKELFDFNGETTGQYPFASLTIANGLLYGTTSVGGGIFSIGLDGKNFKRLMDLKGTNGVEPRGALAFSNNVFYGMTRAGGEFGAGVIFSFRTAPSVPICMVTVDDNSMYNRIIWEKPISATIDSFIVYRETTSNSFNKIATIPYTALSEFVDTVRIKYFPFTGNPNAGTYRYKIQVKDTSGNYSGMSPYHNTLFINQTNGTFTWSQYSIEGQPNVASLSAYVLHRSDNGTGAFHAVASVSGSQTTIADPDFASFPNGKWYIEALWSGACNSSYKTQTTYNSVRSNIKAANPTGIENTFNVQELELFPNPTNSMLNIKLDILSPSNLILNIRNMNGQLIHKSNQEKISGPYLKSIDLMSQAKGIYFLELVVGNNRIHRKIVLN